MHPLAFLHDWIVSHPVTFQIVLTIAVGGLISIYGAEIKEFIRQKPQNLGIWILRSRIAADEKRLRLIRGLSQNPTQAQIYGFGILGLGILGFGAITFLQISIYLNDIHSRSHLSPLFWRVSLLFSLLFFIVVLFIFSRGLKNLLESACPENGLEKLARKINALKVRVVSRDRNGQSGMKR
jgi:uncharacterized BrkB/YihY/UPF0761 family membrane protein